MSTNKVGSPLAQTAVTGGAFAPCPPPSNTAVVVLFTRRETSEPPTPLVVRYVPGNKLCYDAAGWERKPGRKAK